MYSELVVAGILLAVLYYECSHLSPGGMVTPIYFALCLKDPRRILYTLVIVALVWGIEKIIGHFWILYGRRMFAIAVAITFLLEALLASTGMLPAGVKAIGYVVPALLVRDVEKQGVIKTGISLGIVIGLCALCLMWVGIL